MQDASIDEAETHMQDASMGEIERQPLSLISAKALSKGPSLETFWRMRSDNIMLRQKVRWEKEKGEQAVRREKEKGEQAVQREKEKLEQEVKEKENDRDLFTKLLVLEKEARKEERESKKEEQENDHAHWTKLIKSEMEQRQGLLTRSYQMRKDWDKQKKHWRAQKLIFESRQWSNNLQMLIMKGNVHLLGAFDHICGMVYSEWMLRRQLNPWVSMGILSAIMRDKSFSALFKCVVNQSNMNVESCRKLVDTLYDTISGSQHVSSLDLVGFRLSGESECDLVTGIFLQFFSIPCVVVDAAGQELPCSPYTITFHRCLGELEDNIGLIRGEVSECNIGDKAGPQHGSLSSTLSLQ